MLKILQVKLQHYVNQELSDVQAGFRKGRGTRDQIANIFWIHSSNIPFQLSDGCYDVLFNFSFNFATAFEHIL